MVLLLLTVCFVLPLAWWQSAAAAVLLLLVAGYFLRLKVWLLSAESIVSIRLQQEELVLVTRAGHEYAGRLARSTFVTPWLTVVNVRIPHRLRMQSVVILQDSMDRENFRRLRVLLRWGELPLV